MSAVAANRVIRLPELHAMPMPALTDSNHLAFTNSTKRHRKPRQRRAIDPLTEAAVNRFRQHLRTAIDASGEKHVVVAAAIGVQEHYLSKMLAPSGDQRPIGVHHLVALPESVKLALATIQAESLGVMNTFELRMQLNQQLALGLAGVLSALGGHKVIR